MNLILTEKAQEYFKKNKIRFLVLRVSYFTEGCILIKEPKIEIIDKGKLQEVEDFDKLNNTSITLFISNDFKENFDMKDDFQLDLGGKLKKRIILKNFQPIIIRTCKA